MKNNSNLIAEEMLANLISSKPEVNEHFNRIALASEHLNNASDILNELGLESHASLLKNIVVKVAKSKLENLNK